MSWAVKDNSLTRGQQQLERVGTSKTQFHCCKMKIPTIITPTEMWELPGPRPRITQQAHHVRSEPTLLPCDRVSTRYISNRPFPSELDTEELGVSAAMAACILQIVSSVACNAAQMPCGAFSLARPAFSVGVTAARPASRGAE